LWEILEIAEESEVIAPHMIEPTGSHFGKATGMMGGGDGGAPLQVERSKASCAARLSMARIELAMIESHRRTNDTIRRRSVRRAAAMAYVSSSSLVMGAWAIKGTLDVPAFSDGAFCLVASAVSTGRLRLDVPSIWY
jgi:hypothetical protein